jgi:arabinogalactan endo-1,4-beta-galactosidase
MRSHRNSRGTVYVILRVFNLSGNRIRLRVYVDPAEMEANGELVFEAGSWSVTPGPGGI